MNGDNWYDMSMACKPVSKSRLERALALMCCESPRLGVHDRVRVPCSGGARCWVPTSVTSLLCLVILVEKPFLVYPEGRHNRRAKVIQCVGNVGAATSGDARRHQSCTSTLRTGLWNAAERPRMLVFGMELQV